MYNQYDIIDHKLLYLCEEDSVPGLVWLNGDGNKRGAVAQVYDAEAFNDWFNEQFGN